MKSAVLMLGKAGDIINILPILGQRHSRATVKQNLIVARDYLSVVDGLPYVQPIVFDGNWLDFKGGYQFAKKMFDEVECPQMSGNEMVFAHFTPSVMLDSWHRMRMLPEWDSLPLNIPHVEPVEKTKTIFFADHSQSSPFFQKQELFKFLADAFPEHQIIRSSGMRLKSLFDFIPHMDRAQLIVSVETSFLHLSAASKTPVIALAANLPSHWHGSPWSKRFVLHCRYNDFDFRKPEILAAANRAINQHSMPEPVIYPTAKPHGYNMTIGPGFSIYRYHSIASHWKTKLAIQHADGRCADIEFPKECADCSMEDARYFEFNGKPHIAYTCSRAILGKWYCVQAYGELVFDGGSVRVAKHVVPRYKGNDFSGMQKNWAPFVHGGKLHFIFGNLRTTQEQIVLQIEGDRVVKEIRSKAMSWNWGGIRGGAIVPHKNMLLRFFHSRVGDGSRHYQFRYYMGAAIMEPEPPFTTTMVSSFPILAGNEKYTHGCHHWKPNCTLPFGAIVDGDNFIVGLGLNDCECATVKLKWSDLHL